MEDKGFSIGQVVRSRAGRDQQQLFIVVGIVDHEYVLIADGRLRKVQKPKKKKVKHLTKLNAFSHEIKNRIQNHIEVDNAFVYRELERLVGSLD